MHVKLEIKGVKCAVKLESLVFKLYEMNILNDSYHHDMTIRL